MTTGRINQVTAFHCAHRAGSRGSSCANSEPCTLHESSGWHVPCTSQGDCNCHSTGAGLRTASHGATATICNPFTHILLCTVDQLEGTVPATATNSSLGRLVDPGLNRWHSTLLPCATSLQPCLTPVPHTGHKQLIALPWDKHSQRQ